MHFNDEGLAVESERREDASRDMRNFKCCKIRW